MNPYQKRLLAQIEALLRDAGYHRYCIDVQRYLGRGCECLVGVHAGQLAKLKDKVGGLLLDVMNSGLSHRKFLTIIRRLEGGK